ncbi:hypothetical protein EMIHUDRAFT_233398 [Emiliania huxleyi CCMP1516]|uniref:Uncharacterized protein n=2 Tax=Emiliania huxleyi TaxID=2903 RepID=A0A0D3K258_EMIH1|nr:hypothetical protein EMIHUDRAFT_233398 [Emiliania huxleyi CCMP1516]EOD29843.1 hypothetical protein EMIHUDRAFT_233398 [Emiliania huxleyi CCMP1516]|eukprot:XP_005782272.1 hypothetical protein EMIHUDRAFT_233398 [Emiliania huxleyi CCMP1516]
MPAAKKKATYNWRASFFSPHLEFLGPCRFVVQGEGAILEAVGAFEELRVSETPKGALATVSVGDSFECHVRLKEVASASFVSKEKPDGKALHIVRLLDKEGGPLLSAILHAGPDGYEDGAVSFFERLREKFGATVDITDDLEGED